MTPLRAFRSSLCSFWYFFRFLLSLSAFFRRLLSDELESGPLSESEELDDDDDEQRRVQVPVPQTYKAVNSLLHDLHAEHQHRLLWSSSTTGTSTPFAPSPTYVPSSASAVGMAQHHIAQAAHAHLPIPSLPYVPSPSLKEMVNVRLPEPPLPNTRGDDAAMQYEDSNRCGLSI